MMTIRILKHAIPVVLAVALLLQSGASHSGGPRRPDPIALKVVLMPYLAFAPLLIAEEEGYFVEQGLRIEFVKMADVAEAIPALAQGKLDVAAGYTSVAFLNAVARGARVKLVADKSYIAPTGCAYLGLVARRDLVEQGTLTSPVHLKGRRISAARASSSQYLVEKVLASAGLTPADVEMVHVPTAASLDALLKGHIDIAVSGEPWLTQKLKAGAGVLWMPAQQAIPDFQVSSVLYGPSLLEKNPDAGRRFMVAHLKAVRRYNEGKTERNLEILVRRTGLDRQLLKEACWPAVRDDGQINVKSMLDFQAWALGRGLIDAPVKEEQFWDPGFVAYANRALKTPTR